MVETLSELLENAANVAEDNGGKLSIASAAVLIAEAYELERATHNRKVGCSSHLLATLLVNT